MCDFISSSRIHLFFRLEVAQEYLFSILGNKNLKIETQTASKKLISSSKLAKPLIYPFQSA